MEVDASSTTGSRNASPSLPEGAKSFSGTESQAQKKEDNAKVENPVVDKCGELVTHGGVQADVEQPGPLQSGQQNGDSQSNVSGDSCMSREGSVASDPRASGVSCDSCARKGSEICDSRESSVASVSREGSVSCEGVVTETMLQEEQRLLENDTQTASKDVPEEVNDLRNMVEHQRYNRLLHLLQRSTIYSKFLVKRMEGQIEKDKKEQDKQAKKSSKAQLVTSPMTSGRVTRSSAVGKSPSLQSVESSGKKKRGRKRRASPASSFKISDYMDSQGKLKKMKTDGGEGESPLPATPQSSEKKPGPKKPPAGKTAQRYFEGQPIPPRQPKLLTGGIMRSYQLDGMDWIKLLYENGVNGILGDEMGLGKTIQCISVIAYMLERGVTGPFLIAAPLSTVPNWVAEFKRFTPKIPVVLYHGTAAEREQLRRTIFLTQAQITQRQQRLKKKSQSKRTQQPSNSRLLQDVQSVVVTSYEICMRDVKYLQFRSWKFLVVDEGHRIKNLNCKLIKTLKSYDSQNRLLLTGTPLQNNLSELWSLLNFLLPDIFDDLNSFQSWFDFDNAGDDEVKEKIIAQEREQHVLRTLHQILTPFLLRRLKTDVEYSLPPKKEILVYAPLTEHQEKFYKSLLDKSILDLLEKERKEKLGMDGGAVESEDKRTRRKKAVLPCYSQLTDDQFDSIMSGEAELEDFVPTQEETKTDKTKIVVSAVNIKMTSVYTMLRLCSNHPYLLEFPLTPQGEFRVDEELVQCCGKTRMLDRLLTALIKEGHKILLFSQFTRMLDILEDYLGLRGVSFSRLDGSMPFTERQINITRFKSDPKCMVFLLSTRAAGLGLNLTAADTVIIYDSDWNPQADLQAQDRCHRIGQSKPVVVYRLVTANTIDQRIVERAASKRKLEKMVIHKGKFKGAPSDCDLSLDDLSELLHSVEHDKVVSSDGKVISDEALAALLDRTIHTKSAQTVSDQNSDNIGVPEKETSHSGVFKVLEEIGNVVCNKEPGAETKIGSKENKSVSSENSSSNKVDTDSTQDSTQTADGDLQTEGMECEAVNVSVTAAPQSQSNGGEETGSPPTDEDTNLKGDSVQHSKPMVEGVEPSNIPTEPTKCDPSNSLFQPTEHKPSKSSPEPISGEMECEPSNSPSKGNQCTKEEGSCAPQDTQSVEQIRADMAQGKKNLSPSSLSLDGQKDNVMECEGVLTQGGCGSAQLDQ